MAQNVKHIILDYCARYIVQCIIIISSIFLVVEVLSAQHSSFQPVFEPLTTQQGLPHNNVSYIIQDGEGFIWMATKNGLCRYDGYNFINFQYQNDVTTKRNYLSDNNIMDLCLDSSKYLWVGTLSGGLNRIDTRTGETTVFSKKQAPKSGINDDKITSITCDKNGSIWVGTWSGLSVFDNNHQTFTNYNLPFASKPNHVFSLYADDNGIIWVATEFALYHFNSNTKQWSLWKPLATVSAFKKDMKGYLWIGGTFGLRRFNDKTNELISLNDSLYLLLPKGVQVTVNEIELDKQGSLWLGTTNIGVFRYTMSDTEKKWEWFQSIEHRQNSLSHNNIRSLYCDNSGILWIGTRGGGVNKHYPFERLFKYYESPASKKILFDLFTSLQTTVDNTLFIGARNGIFTLSKDDEYVRHVEQYNVRPIPSLPLILGVYVDKKNRVWVSTRNGCYLLEKPPKKNQVFFYSPNKDPQHLLTKRHFSFQWRDTLVPTVQIASVLQDKYGYFWFGTRGGGIYRLDSTYKTIKIYRTNTQKIDENRDLINVLFKDHKETIWAGTDDGLLMLDRAQDTFKIFQHHPQNENSLSHNKVQTLYEDNRGMLWVGTYYGLNVLDKRTEQWQRFFSSDGLSNNIINGIVGETPESNVVWISTENGLNRAAFALTHNSENRISSKIQCTFSNFGHQNGLLYPEFITNGLCRSQDGYLYFAQYNGVLQVNPRVYALSRNYTPPRVVLTSFKKFGKPFGNDIFYSDAQAFEIEEKDNVISFEFIALNYYYSSSNQYSYYLEGFDKSWSEPSTHHQATYTNLYPGTYIFKIKAANNDGVWNQQVQDFVLIVHPPWWKSSWSYLLYGIVGIMGLSLFIVYRERVQRKALREQYQKREADIIFQKNHVLEEVNDRLVLLNTELQGVNEQLQIVNAEKTDIVNLVVHDLKNPVIGIQKLAYSIESLGRKSAQDQIEQSGAVIKHTAERMYSLIQQLLRVHSVEHDKNTMSCIALDVQELTEQYLADLSFRQQHVCIQAEYSSTPPYIAYADPLALLQIIENLISNATKASAHNGVIVVSIGHRIIEHPATEYKTTMLSLSVRDFGIGIDTDQQKALFTKFATIKKSSFDSSSSGLGLYIVKKLVEAMNGLLSFESVPGEGTVFMILLPTVSE